MDDCETPPLMIARYCALDPILKPWAARHGLQIATRHRSEEVRSIPVVDEYGDTYQLFARAEMNNLELIIVGAGLIKRGHKKHTFYRERRNFDFRVDVPVHELESALDAAWERIQGWTRESKQR